MKNTKKTDAKVEFIVKVTRANEIKEGTVAFDMNVNGVNIYGCWYKEYTNKKGEEGVILSFPSQKGKDDKYYNHCWFPISDTLKDDIINQIGELV